MHGCPRVQSIMHQPTICVRDFYHRRVVQHIHPVINVNRHHIIYEHQHIYPQFTRNVAGVQHCNLGPMGMPMFPGGRD